METRQLFRPVGLFELRLIQETHFRAFPPRLSHQPIFYPVLNYEYAEQIARDWNTKDAASGYMGVVTAFDVAEAYLKQFGTQVVGASMHEELWIPAEKLDEFNAQIVGGIRVLTAFYGEQYSGEKLW
jgi:hypothetical protein